MSTRSAFAKSLLSLSLIVLLGPTCFGSTISSLTPGLDVSHHQSNINWSAVQGAGYRFAFIKATQGTGFVDNKFQQNASAAASNGLLVAPYHYTEPDSGHTAAEEVQHFIDNAKGYFSGGAVRPALDLESGFSLGKVALSKWVDEWMTTFIAKTGITPILYTNSNYAKNYLDVSIAKKYDLWIADPGVSSPRTGIWNNQWAFWQHSWTGSVPGISGDVDLDKFNGFYTENFGTGDSYQTNTGNAWAVGSSPYRSIAVSFVNTTNSPYQLDEFRFADNFFSGTNTLNVGFYGGSSDLNSATLLESFTFNAPDQQKSHIFTAVSMLHPTILPGATYFITQSVPTNTIWGWQWNNEGANGNWWAQNASGQWFQEASTFVTPVFDLTAMPVAAPESSTLILLAVGLLCLGGYLSRSTRQRPAFAVASRLGSS